MNRLQTFLKELKQETETTRKMLSRIPDDKYDWKPHEKSMTIRSLATHIAELPTWIGMVLNTTELDFASNPYEPVVINDTARLMEYMEECYAQGVKELEGASEESLDEEWTLRSGEQIFSQTSKADFIRITMSQIIHHRAQMGVYLRLLNIPIPGSYGPSADDMSF